MIRIGASPPREGRRPYSIARFLAALILLIVSEPFIEKLPGGPLVESALLSLVLISAVVAVGGRRRTLVIAVVLVAPALVARWGNHLQPNMTPHAFSLSLALLFMIFILAHLLHFVVRAPRVDSEVLCAAVAIYLLMGITWSFAYMLAARLVPDSFAFSMKNDPTRAMAGFDALYFSFTTMSTGSYGDITPVSNVARLLATLQQIAGVFFVAILISRLVSLYAAPAPQPPPQPPQNPPA